MSSTLGCYTCSELQLGRPCPSAATDRDTWRAGWPCTQSSISHITCFEFSIFIGVFCTYFLARNNNSFEEDNISSPSSWPPSKPSPASSWWTSSWWRSPGSGNYEESSGGESEVCSIIVGSESPNPSESVKLQWTCRNCNIISIPTCSCAHENGASYTRWIANIAAFHLALIFGTFVLKMEIPRRIRPCLPPSHRLVEAVQRQALPHWGLKEYCGTAQGPRCKDQGLKERDK